MKKDEKTSIRETAKRVRIKSKEEAKMNNNESKKRDNFNDNFKFVVIVVLIIIALGAQMKFAIEYGRATASSEIYQAEYERLKGLDSNEASE